MLKKEVESADHTTEETFFFPPPKLKILVEMKHGQDKY